MKERDIRPWLKRADWKAGAIRSSHGKSIELWVILGGFAFMSVMAYSSADGGEPLFWLFLVVIAIVGLVGPGKRFLRRLRDKPATFEFEEVPFIVGDKLRGVIKARLPGTPRELTSAVLECLVPAEDSDDRDRVIRQCSRQWLPNQLQWAGDELHQPVELDIPSGPETGVGGAYWRLTLSSDFPNLNYETYFDVPVYERDAARLVQETAVGRFRKRDIRRAMRVFDE